MKLDLLIFDFSTQEIQALIEAAQELNQTLASVENQMGSGAIIVLRQPFLMSSRMATKRQWMKLSQSKMQLTFQLNEYIRCML